MNRGPYICRKCGQRGHQTKTCKNEVAHCELCRWAASIPMRTVWTISKKRGSGGAAYLVRRHA